MSIKRKLTWTMMGISVAAVMLTVCAITAFLIYDMHQSKRQELAVTAFITADRNGAALMFLDNERAAKNLEVFRANPAILAACIYDAKNTLFASYMRIGKNQEMSFRCPPTTTTLPVGNRGMLTAWQEVNQAGARAGEVFIASDTREINEYVHKILLISGTVTLIVLGGTFLATLYFQRAISKPILELAETAQMISTSKDYTLAARQDYTDETGLLARAFNEMLTEVRLRDLELLNANEGLERKVEERTRELEISKQKAEAASEAKSEFLRNMSHEFRTPLHALVSFTAYGLKESDSAPREQLRGYFEIMQKGAERLIRLVNEVLDLAKMEHGEFVFSMQQSSLRGLAQKSVEFVHPLLAEKKLRLEWRGEEEALAVCDPGKIEQVITNLLSNAIKFTTAESTITVEIATQPSEKNGPQVRLAVIDEGVGIPEEERESIFESFHQSSRTKTGAGGTGLGLTICRRIVTAHGGKIWAENNKDGKGARVVFVIPAEQAEGKRSIQIAA